MNLIDKAAEAQKAAYAPYSRFKVGAAVAGGSGKIYSGCNVENASYGATICAERSAISQAVANGENRIEAVALINSSSSPVMPCGICLQVIAEFAGPDVEIQTASNDKKTVKKLKLKDLLPHAFTQDSLKP